MPTFSTPFARSLLAILLLGVALALQADPSKETATPPEQAVASSSSDGRTSSPQTLPDAPPPGVGRVSDPPSDEAGQPLSAERSGEPGRPAPPSPASISTPAPEDWPALREKTLLAVWDTVNESYYDPTFNGVDWWAMRERYLAKLPAVEDKPALLALLQRMLGELHQTHFAILPRDAAVFTPEERPRIGTVGAEAACLQESVVIMRVQPGSAAERAGLRAGDVVRKVDGLEIELLNRRLIEAGVPPSRRAFYLGQLVNTRLRGAVGTAIQLEVGGAGADAPRVCAPVCEPSTGEWSEPVGHFPSVPISFAATRGDDGVTRLRFNVFTRELMKQIKSTLLTMPREGGLVIDLRGNPGGISYMAPGITGWLTDRAGNLGTMRLRQGLLNFAVFPQAGAFLGPVAVLIDSGSASTSEILAAGLQETGRARVFGETSAGAALPSLFKVLPTGDLLQYAVADLQTPRGNLIEGHGVAPDDRVAYTAADLHVGRDPVMEAALAWLHYRLAKPTAAPAAAQK